MVPYCKDAGIGLIPWSALARGVLARPFSERGGVRDENDKLLAALVRGQNSDNVDEIIIGRVEEIAAARGVSMAIIALAWCLKKGAFPITGMNTKKRMDEAIEAINLDLTDKETLYLEEVYKPKLVKY